MKETVQQIDHLFSTADAEDVDFRHDGSDLIVCFTDWHEVRHEVMFPDAIFVQWDELLDEKFAYDMPHEIVNSTQIPKRTQNPDHYHHYMLCFNAASNLEVISHELKIKKRENT